MLYSLYAIAYTRLSACVVENLKRRQMPTTPRFHNLTTHKQTLAKWKKKNETEPETCKQNWIETCWIGSWILDSCHEQTTAQSRGRNSQLTSRTSAPASPQFTSHNLQNVWNRHFVCVDGYHRGCVSLEKSEHSTYVRARMMRGIRKDAASEGIHLY